MKITRRELVQGLLVGSGTALFGERLPAEAVSPPDPEESGLDHIVVVMMENRSFDHLLGWLANARGEQEGLVYEDRQGVAQPTYRLAHDDKGCGHPDPDHSYRGGREQRNGGSMDGFLRSGANDLYAIGYYLESDRPFFGALARQYTTLDSYFCSVLGPTFPNRIFQHAGQTDRLSNTIDVSDLPTIWDRLEDAGVSARYYYSNIPVLSLWGSKYVSISASYRKFLEDAAAGTLPAVSFVDPRFTLIGDAWSNDDHPHADIRAGDAFLSATFRALSRGPRWTRTALVVNYDEWGGFFDHVPPPRVVAANGVDPDVVDGKALLGFRVPSVIASPWTRGNPASPRIGRSLSDHTSVLKLIEWRWQLAPLSFRDASAEISDLTELFRWDHHDARVPLLPRVSRPRPLDCRQQAVSVNRDDSFRELIESGLTAGWPLYTR